MVIVRDQVQLTYGFSRLWTKLMEKESKGAHSCIDFEKGVKPHYSRVRGKNEDVKMFPKLWPKMKYVDVISHLCYETGEARNDVLSHLSEHNSGVLYENGYWRDGLYLSFNGSRGHCCYQHCYRHVSVTEIKVRITLIL